MQIQMFQICIVERIIHVSDAFARLPRILFTLIAAAIFALYSIVVPSAAAAQTQPLIGNHPTANVANMRSHADATRPLNIHISFAPRNPVALAKLLADLQNPASPLYHKWLSPAQFNARFGRSADEVAAVREWLSAGGMRVIESSPRGLTTSATVAQAESALSTPMIASTDGTLYANANDPQNSSEIRRYNWINRGSRQHPSLARDGDTSAPSERHAYHGFLQSADQDLSVARTALA
jgi:hypothetical protein